MHRSPPTRRLALAAAALAAALAVALPAAASAAPDCQPSGNNTVCTVSYTGAEQSLALPLGTTAVTVTAVGAPGGSSSAAAGGHGARVSATVPLPTGTTTLYAEVGGPGGAHATGDLFTFNGGAISEHGGWGGGASDVRTCSLSDCPIAPDPAVDSRLVVAGGGGGAGAFDCIGAPGGQAGDPSVTGAGAGGNCGADSAYWAGGYGGTTGGAAGGIGDCAGAGSAFLGLGGPADHLYVYNTSTQQIDAPVLCGGDSGGGGGGGYYGGGGGSHVNVVGGAGGGAGSSFWAPAATNTSMSTDTTDIPQITITYHAGYGFAGFLAPVDNLDANGNPVLNVVKAGQAIPLKWRLTDATGAPVTTLASAQITATGITCTAGATTDQLEELAAGASGLQNLGDGNYQLNWKSPTSYANSCKRLRLDLGDGSSHTADFKFTK
jgi:adhesin/invasin